MREGSMLWTLRHACQDAWRMARFERHALGQMALDWARRRGQGAREFFQIFAWSLKVSAALLTFWLLSLFLVALADFAWSSAKLAPHAIAMIVPARSCALGEHLLKQARDLPPSLLPVAADVLKRQNEGMAAPCRAEIGPQGQHQWALLLQAPPGQHRLQWAASQNARDFARRIGAPAATFEPVERGPFWRSLAEGLGLLNATRVSRAQAMSSAPSLWLGFRGARFERWVGPALLVLSQSAMAFLFWKQRRAWLDDLRGLASSLPSPRRLARQGALALPILGGLWTLGWILFAGALLVLPEPEPVLAAPASQNECAVVLADRVSPVFCRLEGSVAIAIAPKSRQRSPSMAALRKVNFPSLPEAAWQTQAWPSNPAQAWRAAGEVAGLLTPSKASRAIFYGQTLEPWLGLAIFALLGGAGAFLASQAPSIAGSLCDLARRAAKLPAAALRSLGARDDFQARAIRRELDDDTPHSAPRRGRGRL